ncbi:MAG: carbon-nitrogen hydrolase family protein [Gemmatimonadota bacterium]
MAPALGRPLANAGAAAEEIVAGAAEGGRLVVLPEAALTGYVFDSREEAMGAAVHADGEEVRLLEEACRSADAWAVCGAIEREEAPGGEPVLYNTAFLIGPAGRVRRFRKVHTLCLGADRFVRPGPDGFAVFPIPLGRLGVHICYDGSFPESARILKLLGAQLLLLPTNWPNLRLKRELVQVRAYENHVNVLAVNRVGVERGVRFEGGSCAADSQGRLLLAAGSETGRFHVEFDLEAADHTREVVEPGAYEYDRIADRRPEMYDALLESPPDAEKTGSRKAAPA